MGIAVLAEEIVADDVTNRRLRRVLPQWQATPVPVYAITETRLYRRRRNASSSSCVRAWDSND